MELRSGRRLRRSSPPHGIRSQRTDLISALPDEMLLQVLARLRCIHAAAQTRLLSRRWQGLWIGLWNGPTDLTFRGLAPATIEALFRRFATASTQVSTLDIGLPRISSAADDANSLLRAAVRLSPAHLAFTLQEPYVAYNMGHIELPCFECATSFNIATRHISLKPPPAGEFAALESLSVTTGHIIDLGPFLVRCPRLRVLSITYPHNNSTISIPDDEFPALEELSLSALTIDIMAPCSTAATACAC
jgi:hypothetical protein